MSMKTCIKCGIQFEFTAKKRTTITCNPCNAKYQRDYMRGYRLKNKDFETERLRQRRQDPQWVEGERKRGREYWAKLKYECFMAYGGYVCACCGETEEKFLTLDHVNNDGSAHRKEIGNRGAGIFKWLKDHGYPKEGFQILCMNCNHGKALNNGICPHKSATMKTA